jgi:hypothetical protein
MSQCVVFGCTCEGATENTQRYERPKGPPKLDGHALHTISRCGEKTLVYARSTKMKPSTACAGTWNTKPKPTPTRVRQSTVLRPMASESLGHTNSAPNMPAGYAAVRKPTLEAGSEKCSASACNTKQ